MKSISCLIDNVTSCVIVAMYDQSMLKCWQFDLSVVCAPQQIQPDAKLMFTDEFACEYVLNVIE